MILNDEVSANAILKRATKHYTVVIKPLMTTYNWTAVSGAQLPLASAPAAAGHRRMHRNPNIQRVPV